MSVPYQRISNATMDDILFYDPAADRRAISMDLFDWDTYLNVASQEILYQLEWSWWPQYVEKTFGSQYWKNNEDGKLISAFDPSLLVLDNQTLKRLDVFKAIEIFYGTVVTDVSNVNEVDHVNYEFAKKRYEEEYGKAVELSNFYDMDSDGIITKLEENYQANPDYMGSGDRRYM